jgi:hypothetical protein
MWVRATAKTRAVNAWNRLGTNGVRIAGFAAVRLRSLRDVGTAANLPLQLPNYRENCVEFGAYSLTVALGRPAGGPRPCRSIPMARRSYGSEAVSSTVPHCDVVSTFR